MSTIDERKIHQQHVLTGRYGNSLALYVFENSRASLLDCRDNGARCEGQKPYRTKAGVTEILNRVKCLPILPLRICISPSFTL